MDDTTAPDAVAPPPRHPRFPAVDGVRALAVVAVVGVHAAAVSHGAVNGSIVGRLIARLNIGVTIFFVISGFLLYRPMIASRLGGPPAPLVGDYLKRRLLRIYPAYWLVLTVLALLPGAPQVLFGPWWAMYGLVHTLPLYSGRGCVSAFAPPCGLAQTWSLVVELTFYAALPAFAFAMHRLTARARPSTWLALQLGVLFAISTVSVVLQLRPVPAWFGATVPAYALWFALGMALATVSVWTTSTARRPPRAWPRRAPEMMWIAAFASYLGIALWLPATTFLVDRAQVMTGHVVYGLAAALIVMPAVLGNGRSIPERLLTWAPLAWLGLVSYGVFLWHLAIIMMLPAGSFAVVMAEALLASAACAAVSYYAVERPMLSLKYTHVRGIPARVSRAAELLRVRQ